MKSLIKFIIIVSILLPGFAGLAISVSYDPIDKVLMELYSELEVTTKKYDALNDVAQLKLYDIHSELMIAKDNDTKIELLIRKESLRNEISNNKLRQLSELSKIRYLKGLQIIKILYEKTLSLDHHFASVSTFREINNISNPNHYPEFTAVREMLNNKKDKRTGFDLSEILGNNIYTSVIHSLVSLFSNQSASKGQKESSLKEIECILDFTLRMHNDLNTIYFETVFLQKNNETIMGDLQKLFVDYTKPIKYDVSLKQCRNKDDWDSIRNNLNIYLEKLDLAISTESTKAHKMQINLNFPIDRLLQFITQYNAFIDQGGQFYEKFGIMLNSYENEQQCGNKIAKEYSTLKANINVAIEKFNTAYKPIEINGSKMKEVLYGINEYD